MKIKLNVGILLAAMITGLPFMVSAQSGRNYENFEVAVYSRAYETARMGDDQWLIPVWDEVSRQVKVDKIYLETHRDLLIVDEDVLSKAKAFFQSRGVRTAGGITLTVDEGNYFETFCYVNPEHRNKVREIVEYTARHFDELILDDFFFTSCKCELCIQAKGNRSWTDFRLQLMTEAAEELVIRPARAVNPDVKVVIKYPNWYDHFQGCGFNLETQPQMFDGLYTGTETRDPRSNQHLQPYLGYLIFRYFEHLKPGGNGGGWVDTGGLTSMDRYAEQLWLTLFAKAPEITLFDIRQLQRPLRETDRAPWQDNGDSSFNYDKMIQPFRDEDGVIVQPSTIARAAGYTLEMVDEFVGMLGTPLGVKSYKPFHSHGEDFLQNYMGMLGVPMEIVSEFPEDEPIIFLTEQAASDELIIDKIKKQLISGNDVMITSGFLNVMQDSGLGDIAELRMTGGKAVVNEFVSGWGRRSFSEKDMLIPQIKYLTNDSWEVVSAFNGSNGWPVIHRCGYANGELYVLNIPDNVIDLYYLPREVLARIRQILTPHMPVLLEDAPGYTSLFVYDNNMLIAESFADEPLTIRLQTASGVKALHNVQTGEIMTGNNTEVFQARGLPPIEKQVFELKIMPHSFVVLKMQ